MKYVVTAVCLLQFGAINLLAADVAPEFVEAALGRRKEIPPGGDFRPDPKSPVFVAVGHGGRIVLSRDDGKTWKQVFWGHAGSDHGPWATKAVAYGGIVSNGELVAIADKVGANVFVSADAGNSWDGPFATGVERATLSLVGKAFWLVSTKAARGSIDGRSWRDLPKGIPAGKIVASPKGTLISIDRRRFNILRSADNGETWNEAYNFKPETEHVHGAQGLRDVAFGYVTAKPLDR